MAAAQRIDFRHQPTISISAAPHVIGTMMRMRSMSCAGVSTFTNHEARGQLLEG
eukprot:CAMPEP_0119358088 /NCGR_PEP_ID=MMETSP1334-20130426/6372_1 /TAXON_ID=127549 /ORGANISM="Calcidiscus leptoporus, Strain RCC1130" /LENGTH=53 /DNA_ID=CAMNT_0007372503 /DNA_START=991 /DNA_END=1148 /DNA_ORIENTATION=+